MGIENIIAMLGGLALFLYGMNMMSDGLEQAAGNKMKQTTVNHFIITCKPLDQRLLAALSSPNQLPDQRLLSHLISTSQPVDQLLSAA